MTWPRVRFHVNLYAKLILLQLRTAVEYRADFWIGIVGAVLMNGAALVFLSAFFSRIPAVGGWTVWEVATLYGLTMIAYGLREMLCDGVWTLRAQINLGNFDRVLLRPISPALQLATSLASIHGVGNFLLGLVVFLTAARRLDLDWTVGKILWLLLTVACGLVVVASISLLANIIGFWEPGTQSSFPFMVSNVVEFAKFPLELYGWAIRLIVTAILPYAFVSYYPALILLDKESDWRWLGYLTPLAAAAIALFAAWLWRLGLARYQGVGH